MQEGNGCAARCPFPVFPSTKSVFLCAFACRNPRFQAFRAQNRGFCAFLAFRTLVFGLPEHKIGIFVRFCPPKPLFSGFPSTKSGFLCFFSLQNPRFRAFRAQNRGFCALSPILWAPYRYESNAETLSPQLKINIIICIVISCQYLGVVLQRVNYGGSILCLLFYFSLHWC